MFEVRWRGDEERRREAVLQVGMHGASREDEMNKMGRDAVARASHTRLPTKEPSTGCIMSKRTSHKALNEGCAPRAFANPASPWWRIKNA